MSTSTPTGRTRELDGDILHYPYKHFREHLDKINSYAQQGADDLAARGKRAASPSACCTASGGSSVSTCSKRLP